MRILTKKYLSKIDEIKTKGYITPGFDQKNPSDYLPYCELDNIQWDTGATQSVINKVLVEPLGLKPIGKDYVDGFGGTNVSYIYEVNIYTEGELSFKRIKVLAGDIGGCDVLLGMDIISQGDFAITNKDNQTWFSFRYPSQDHIEFNA